MMCVVVVCDSRCRWYVRLELVTVGHMCDFLFFFKQKTAYEMRISDWSSDVCSSDLRRPPRGSRRARRLTNSASAAGFACCNSSANPAASTFANEIGRASCRERVCQYV